MKKIIILINFCLLLSKLSFGQLNPVRVSNQENVWYLFDTSNKIYYRASNYTTYKQEIWETNELNQEKKILDIVSLNDAIYYNNGIILCGSNVSSANAFQSMYYFSFTDNSLTMLKNNLYGRKFFIYNNEVYFHVQETSNIALWKTDGTANGTVEVDKLNSQISSYQILNNVLYYITSGTNNDYILWKRNSNANSASQIKNIGNSSNTDNLVSFKNNIYFTSCDNTNGCELWKSDGTVQNTKLVQDVTPMLQGYVQNTSPTNFAITDNYLYFRGAYNNSVGSDSYPLLRTDGNKIEKAQSPLYNVQKITSFNNKIILTGQLPNCSDLGYYELWMYDEATNSTNLIKDINTDRCYGGSINYINVFGNYALFKAGDKNTEALFISKGSTDSTFLLKDFDAGNRYWTVNFYKGTNRLILETESDDKSTPISHLNQLWTVSFNKSTTTCTQSPTTPTASASSTSINAGQSVTLSVTSGNLNCSSASWKWYSGTCGGTAVGTGSSISVTPSSTTIYYVRGEGTNTTSGGCGSVVINVTPANYGFKVTANGVASDGTNVADWSKAFWSTPYIPTGSTATIGNPIVDNGTIKIQCNNVKLYNNVALNLTGLIIANNGSYDLSLPQNQKIAIKLKSSANVSFVLDVNDASYKSYFNWGANRPNITVVSDGSFKWYTFDLKGKFTTTPDKAFMVGLNYISSTPFTGDIWVDEMLVGEFVPTISQTSSLSNFVTNVNTPSKAQSINISGTSLIDLININAPSGYEITTDTLGVWSSQLQVSGTNAKLFVRAKAQSASNAITGNLTLTSTAAVNVTIPLNGSVINGINDKLWSNQIKLIPNPVIDYLEISSEQKSISKYTIYSSLGEIVLSNSNWTETEKIDVRHLPSGIYIIKVADYENAKIIKFVKH